VSWALKKQNSVALSTAEAEYIVVGHCCAQLLWMRQTLKDYGYKLSKVPLLCDIESATRMVDNPVEHSRTKHIAIRYHFLRDHQQRGDIEIAYVSTKEQLSDIFTKPLDEKNLYQT
jgi:pyruvate-formate lyase